MEFGSMGVARFAAAWRQRWRGDSRRWLERVILSVGAGLALLGVAAAQDYPARQIVLIVPFPAGGSTDGIARIIAEPMRQVLGQTVVVQNVPGAGATIGVGRAIQSAPDGYTLSVGNWTSHVGASAVYPVSWHVLNDLEPVAMLSTTTLIIAARTGLPVNNGKELIAWLKANPDQATVATVGAGSGAHICGIYFEQKTGTKFRYVPYRGGAPVMADLMANQVDLFCGEA
jgi:tripartite-type tricarboxylate transporter receptor subunit TctC